MNANRLFTSVSKQYVSFDLQNRDLSCCCNKLRTHIYISRVKVTMVHITNTSHVLDLCNHHTSRGWCPTQQGYYHHHKYNHLTAAAYRRCKTIKLIIGLLRGNNDITMLKRWLIFRFSASVYVLSHVLVLMDIGLLVWSGWWTRSEWVHVLFCHGKLFTRNMTGQPFMFTSFDSNSRKKDFW